MTDEDQTEKVQILQTSVPEFLLRPLLLLPWFKDQNIRQVHHHEHMTTGWLVGMLCAALKHLNPWVAAAVYCAAFSWHVVVKELWLDRHKNEGRPEQRNADLTTRVWGMLHGFIWVLT